MTTEKYSYISILPESCIGCPIFRKAADALKSMQEPSDLRIPHIINCKETHWLFIIPQRSITAVLRPQQWLLMNRIPDPESDALRVDFFGMCRKNEEIIYSQTSDPSVLASQG